MKTVFVVIRKIYNYKDGICYRYSYENHGVFTTNEKAEELADKFNTSCTDGLVVEVELDKEVIF